MAFLAGSAKTALRQATASPVLGWGGITVAIGDTVVVLSCQDTSTSDTIPTDDLLNTYAFAGTKFTDSFFDIHSVATARVTNPGTLNNTTFHLPGTPSAGGFAGCILTGRASTSWVNTLTSAEQATPTGADAVTCGAHTALDGDDMVLFTVDLGGTQGVFAAGTNFTEQAETPTTTPGVDFDIAVSTRLNLAAGSVTPVGTNTNASRTVSLAITVKAGSVVATPAEPMRTRQPQRWEQRSRGLAEQIIAPPAINGTAAITLADVAASGTGVLDLLAAATITLGDVTLASAAVLDILANASVTLGDVTPSAAGLLDIQAQASLTLGDVAPASTAALVIAGTASNTLGDVTLSAAGVGTQPSQLVDNQIAGRMLAAWYRGLSLSYQLPAGAAPIQGQASITLADVTPSSTANLDIAASANPTLGDVTVSAAGAIDITAQAGVTVGNVTPGATAAVVLKAVSSVTLGDVTMLATGTGQAVSIGSADVILGPVTCTSAGAVKVASSASINLGDVQVSASGGIRLAASGAVQLQPVALVSAGLVSDTPNTPVTFIDSKTRLSAESLPYRTRPYS